MVGSLGRRAAENGRRRGTAGIERERPEGKGSRQGSVPVPCFGLHPPRLPSSPFPSVPSFRDVSLLFPLGLSRRSSSSFPPFPFLDVRGWERAKERGVRMASEGRNGGRMSFCLVAPHVHRPWRKGSAVPLPSTFDRRRNETGQRKDRKGNRVGFLGIGGEGTEPPRGFERVERDRPLRGARRGDTRTALRPAPGEASSLPLSLVSERRRAPPPSPSLRTSRLPTKSEEGVSHPRLPPLLVSVRVRRGGVKENVRSFRALLFWIRRRLSRSDTKSETEEFDRIEKQEG